VEYYETKPFKLNNMKLNQKIVFLFLLVFIAGFTVSLLTKHADLFAFSSFFIVMLTGALAVSKA